MEQKPSIKEQVAMLPLLPGVYQFVDSSGTIIYVGKAKQLRKRVSSYFLESKQHSSKVRVMVRHIVEIRHIVVATETDALLLENNLIKQLQPKYNILLKDDKTYPWIVVRNEPFPRIESTRRLHRDGSKYFGPYASIAVQRNLLELIHTLYPIRTCTLNLSEEMIGRGKYSTCLQYHIGNCKAPCVGRQLPSDYARSVEIVSATLSGDLKQAKEYLTTQMEEAAQTMNFELAHSFKMKLELLANYTSKSVIVSSTMGSIDLFSIIIDDEAAYCNFVRTMSGAIVNSFTVQFELGAEDDPVSIFSSAISEMSEKITGGLAKEVIVPFLPAVELFPDTEFIVPKRGDKLKLLEFSERNCKMYRLERLKNLEIQDPDRHTSRIMSAMQRELHMSVEPRYIECFDNSNLQGTHPVAACVVFRDGKPSKKDYRHFNVKSVVGPDDFASMREILYRRYSRLLKEGAELPQLIVVDGGKGQLSSAYAILRELGIEDRITIIGLAKRIEEVFFPNDPTPYYLDRKGEPLRVIMHIRDEAHRFGITFHRNKRSAAFIKSQLEEIPTLGKVSIEKLLKKFKTVSAIRRATPEALAEVVGKAKSDAIIAFFSNNPE